MGNTVREYTFINGPETATQPAAGTPSADEDFVTKIYNKTVEGTEASPTSLDAGDSITFPATTTYKIIFVDGNGGAVDLTSNPQIETANASVGDEIEIIGTDATNTVTLDDGNGLRLNGSCILTDEMSIKLTFNGTLWREIGRTF